jgi:hypothetical protein
MKVFSTCKNLGRFKSKFATKMTREYLILMFCAQWVLVRLVQTTTNALYLCT